MLNRVQKFSDKIFRIILNPGLFWPSSGAERKRAGKVLEQKEYP